jgi:hypothetical protein
MVCNLMIIHVIIASSLYADITQAADLLDFIHNGIEKTFE